jgi:hypothetical protein
MLCGYLKQNLEALTSAELRRILKQLAKCKALYQNLPGMTEESYQYP